MKKIIFAFLLVFSANLMAEKKLNVVTTLQLYGYITKKIGGKYVKVTSLVKGYEDPHYVRPKPSFIKKLADADMLVSTGLDLELWLPTLLDKAGNPNIRSGQIGYVAASDGIKLLDKPSVLSRSEGGVHIYGNPHIQTGPINTVIIAENIAIGLKKLMPEHKDYFEKNLKKFKKEIYHFIFGEKLVKLIGGSLLKKLVENGTFWQFVENKTYKGKKLVEYLGGLLKKALPLKGKMIVAYHKNWPYFKALFGIEIVDYLEPKPGIPPTPKHLEEVIKLMKKYNIKVLLAGNYYDEGKIRKVCNKVGAIPVIVPMDVGGMKGINTLEDVYNYWIDHLLDAFKKSGQS